MPYIEISNREMGEAKYVLNEENISFEEIGVGSLDEEIKTETFFANIGRFTQGQFDDFLKSLK